MKQLLSIILYGAALLTSAAFAEEYTQDSNTVAYNNSQENYMPPTPTPKGFYVGGGVGEADLKYTVPGYDTHHVDFALSPYVGYLFNPYVSLEVGYTNLPNVDYSGGHVIDNTYLFDLASKVIIPVAYNFKLIGKFGIAYVNVNYENTLNQGFSAGDYAEYVPYFGAGALYRINPHLDCNLQYAMTPSSGHVPESSALTIGFTHLFQS